VVNNTKNTQSTNKHNKKNLTNINLATQNNILIQDHHLNKIINIDLLIGPSILYNYCMQHRNRMPLVVTLIYTDNMKSSPKG